MCPRHNLWLWDQTQKLSQLLPHLLRTKYWLVGEETSESYVFDSWFEYLKDCLAAPQTHFWGCDLRVKLSSRVSYNPTINTF